jgi:hypothetical protein
MPSKARPSRIPIPFDELGAPAARALQSAGYKTLGQLTRRTEREIAALHGVGPHAINVLRKHMLLNKLAFAKQ